MTRTGFKKDILIFANPEGVEESRLDFCIMKTGFKKGVLIFTKPSRGPKSRFDFSKTLFFIVPVKRKNLGKRR